MYLSPPTPSFSALNSMCTPVAALRLFHRALRSSPHPRGPQGLLACTRLTELVVGALLLARAGEGELERLVAALPALARLEVRGASFEPRAVRHLLGVQRLAGRLGRPVVEVTGG